MKAFVTGGAGFIGSNLVDALVERGDDVEVLDDLSTGRAANLEGALARGAVLHEADIRDGERVAELVAAAAPDVIFHLAAQIDVRRAVADPAFDAQVNVGGTINVLEAARRAGVARVVNSSTGGAIYGDADGDPDRRGPPAGADGALRPEQARGRGLPRPLRPPARPVGVSLRYANVYGPRQDPHGEGGVVAIFCGKLVEGGTPVAFGDGLQTRDYVYVGDVVAANLAAAASGWEGACNIGTGTETTVVELADALRALGDGPFALEHAPARPGEVFRSTVDPALAREVLGWEPRVGLAEGLRRTLASIRA